MSPLRIVMALIKFSLCIGLFGGLVDMTRAMMFRAADAQRVGLVSLTDLNRALGLQPTRQVKRSTPVELNL